MNDLAQLSSVWTLITAHGPLKHSVPIANHMDPLQSILVLLSSGDLDRKYRAIHSRTRCVLNDALITAPHVAGGLQYWLVSTFATFWFFTGDHFVPMSTSRL